MSGKYGFSQVQSLVGWWWLPGVYVERFLKPCPSIMGKGARTDSVELTITTERRRNKVCPRSLPFFGRADIFLLHKSFLWPFLLEVDPPSLTHIFHSWISEQPWATIWAPLCLHFPWINKILISIQRVVLSVIRTKTWQTFCLMPYKKPALNVSMSPISTSPWPIICSSVCHGSSHLSTQRWNQKTLDFETFYSYLFHSQAVWPSLIYHCVSAI